jgi:4-hydroxybenzoate polyprenyltransferase
MRWQDSFYHKVEFRARLILVGQVSSPSTSVVLLLCLAADVGYAFTFDLLTTIAHIAAIILGLSMSGLRFTIFKDDNSKILPPQGEEPVVKE